MAVSANLRARDLAEFERRPDKTIQGALGGRAFRARLGIPRYGDRVMRHYGANADTAGLALDFAHFGVIVEFDTPIELEIHDSERTLDEGLRDAVARFGPVILRNAHLCAARRAEGQRNIFQSLSFHIDRGMTQPDHYSLFWRDPFDPVQRAPRTSSTLIVPNAVAYLQALKQGQPPHEFRSRYDLFVEEDVLALVDDIVLEQPWRAPDGTGEICILDNRTVLHASYYARARDKGYPIGVRYLF